MSEGTSAVVVVVGNDSRPYASKRFYYSRCFTQLLFDDMFV